MWMGQRGPSEGRWAADIVEWTVAEEVHLKGCRHEEWVQEAIEVWMGLLDRFTDAVGWGH